MDVRNLNAPDKNYIKNKLKKPICTSTITQFSIETYFVWFSLLIYVTEIIVDFWVAFYYIFKNEITYGWITLGIIIVPLIVCQMYSLWLFRGDDNIKMNTIFLHLILLAIPKRYINILQNIDKDKLMNHQELEIIKRDIHNINAIQTLNAITQYSPQFLFQSFLIVYRRYKCVITGVSAGLAGFSFLWHISIQFYYWLKRCNKSCISSNCTQANSFTEQNDLTLGNLSTSIPNHRSDNLQSSSTCSSLLISNDNLNQIDQITPTTSTSVITGTASNFSENIKILVKPSIYKTDERNLVTKKIGLKNVEKNIFGFNKRKPIYTSNNEFDSFNDLNNSLPVFYEIDDYKNLSSMADKSMNKEFNSDYCTTSFTNYDDAEMKSMNKSAMANNAPENANTILKRKGICSSQEMLHLVDIKNDNISAEQIDILAKSLIELGGDKLSAQPTEPSEHDAASSIVMLDDSKLLFEQFPDYIDDKLMENIDAAIYENQIIFQERILKNQLTIQNLKLQDQLLSNDIKTNEAVLSIRDYENMCFANINRQSGIKHWRNYLQEMNTNVHDNSTVQHSSFYVNTNTLSNSLTDLYIIENGENDNKSTDYDIVNSKSSLLNRQTVRWRSKLADEEYRLNNNVPSNCDGAGATTDNSIVSDDLYVQMNGRVEVDDDASESAQGAYALPEKNILVETINKINLDTPIKNIIGGANKTSQNVNNNLNIYIEY